MTEEHPPFDADRHRRLITPQEGGLRAVLREDWVAHGRDWTLPGLRALALNRFGKLQVSSTRRSVRAFVRVTHRVAFRLVRNHYGIELPYEVLIGRRTIIEHQGAIVVHGCVQIGDDCRIRQGVTLGNRRLDAPFDAPRLGSRVDVGSGAKVLGGVVVGDDVCIGANAVVLTDLPSGCTAVGVPAVVVRSGRVTGSTPEQAPGPTK